MPTRHRHRRAKTTTAQATHPHRTPFESIREFRAALPAHTRTTIRLAGMVSCVPGSKKTRRPSCTYYACITAVIVKWFREKSRISESASVSRWSSLRSLRPSLPPAARPPHSVIRFSSIPCRQRRGARGPEKHTRVSCRPNPRRSFLPAPASKRFIEQSKVSPHLCI